MDDYYHSALYAVAGSALMSFDPVNRIHQHLCAFHTYSQDRSRHVEAHHYCAHLSDDFHQCVIYDSDGPNAKLIGIEYIVSEKVFEGLPKEEKPYWHSHQYEVESGLLQMQTKKFVPAAVLNLAEKPAMAVLHKTYGKTIHTWPVDVSPELPLGPPNLMMSYTSEEQVPHELVRARDERLGMETDAQKKRRQGYLPSYQKHGDADAWESTGRGVDFVPTIYAQTQTIVDQAGNSVVVVATLDPAGIPLTQTIETLPAGAAGGAAAPTTTTTNPATTTTPTITTQTPAGPGPVGQPAATTGTPFGPTPFTYTTVINGVTTAIADVFTPTDPATTPFTPAATGTVWDYSQWLSSFGGSQATAAAAGQNAGHQLRAKDSALIVMMTICLLPLFHLF